MAAENGLMSKYFQPVCIYIAVTRVNAPLINASIVLSIYKKSDQKDLDLVLLLPFLPFSPLFFYGA